MSCCLISLVLFLWRVKQTQMHKLYTVTWAHDKNMRARSIWNQTRHPPKLDTFPTHVPPASMWGGWSRTRASAETRETSQPCLFKLLLTMHHRTGNPRRKMLSALFHILYTDRVSLDAGFLRIWHKLEWEYGQKINDCANLTRKKKKKHQLVLIY